MKNFSVILYLFFTLNLFSCMTKKHSQTSWNSENSRNDSKSDVKEQYPHAELGLFSKTNDSYTLEEVTIEGNFMILKVSYSGGCEQHDFRLIGSEMLSKSLPPIRAIQLVHNSKGDKCKSIVNETLKFSISNLAYKYESGSKIKLQLENYTNQLEYTYE
jgi:hypothetical protein